MSKEVAKRITEAREALAMTKSELARRMNVSAATITQWESGQTKTYDAENIRKAAKVLHKSFDELLTGWESRSAEADAEPEERLLQVGSWVPVLGEARLGDNGFFAETSYEPHTEGDVLYPQADPEAFALRCKGDSMYPAIQSGDYVVISRKRTPREGNLVMCQTTDGRRMIKNLGRRRDGAIQFLSLNNGFNPITLDEDEIAHLYAADGPIPPSYHKPSGG